MFFVRKKGKRGKERREREKGRTKNSRFKDKHREKSIDRKRSNLNEKKIEF